MKLKSSSETLLVNFVENSGVWLANFPLRRIAFTLLIFGAVLGESGAPVGTIVNAEGLGNGGSLELPKVHGSGEGFEPKLLRYGPDPKRPGHTNLWALSTENQMFIDDGLQQIAIGDFIGGPTNLGTVVSAWEQYKFYDDARYILFDETSGKQRELFKSKESDPDDEGTGGLDGTGNPPDSIRFNNLALEAGHKYRVIINKDDNTASVGTFTAAFPQP